MTQVPSKQRLWVHYKFEASLSISEFRACEGYILRRVCVCKLVKVTRLVILLTGFNISYMQVVYAFKGLEYLVVAFLFYFLTS